MAIRILIAEDDAEIADLLRMALEDEGYQADSVSEAQAAISALGETNYALLIADQLQGPSGGLTDALRHWVVQVARGQPTILLTARDWAAYITPEARAELAAELGVAAILPKPFDVDALLDLVARLTADGPAAN